MSVSPTNPTDPLRESSSIQGTGPIRQEPSPEPMKSEPQKEFHGPDTLQQSKEGVQQSSKPSPMDIAKDAARTEEVDPEKVQAQVGQLKNTMRYTQDKLQNSDNLAEPMTKEHDSALSKLSNLAGNDIKRAARSAGVDYTPVERKEGQGIKEFLTDWLDGGQKTMSNVMESLPNMQGGDLTGFMRVQMSVQRATQRVELMASIIGSTVGGIKTLMGTQLG